MKAGLESVGDLLRTFPSIMSTHVSELTDYMIENLTNFSISKEARISIFTTIADIAVSFPEEIKKRLDSLLKIYLFAFEAIYKLVTEEVRLAHQSDFANLEYAERMKVSAIDSLHFIAYKMLEQGISDESVRQKLQDFVTPLGIFLSKTFEESLRPSEVAQTHQYFFEKTILLLCILGEGKVLKLGENFDKSVLDTYRQKLFLLNQKANNRYANHLDYAVSVFGN